MNGQDLERFEEMRMSSGLKMRYDSEVDALYLQLRNDDIAETLVIEEHVYIDVDKDGRALGIEFVSGSDFLPFLQRHGGHHSVPEQIRAEETVAT